MPDNVQLPATGTGTADIVVATEKIAGVDFQFVKLVDSTDDSTARTGIVGAPFYVRLSDGASAVAPALEAGGNLAGAATSLAIMDDWDESDRCKVNLIVGQAGIAAGAGAVGATVPRVTLASDDPAVASLGIIDDWDESDRAKANIIVGQAGITAGAGAVAANTPRVTHASDDPVTTSVQLIDDGIGTAGSAATTKGMTALGSDGTNSRIISTDTSGRTVSVGAAASGASKAGNPVQIGGVFNTTQPTVTTGQAVELQATARGGLIVSVGVDGFAITGAVTANAGTNLNTSLLALEAGGNLAAAAASLSVVDDWDESDRIKANLIIAQAGITGGAGAVAANTPRVTLASDDAALVSLGLLDDAVYTTATGTVSKIIGVGGNDGTNPRVFITDTTGRLMVVGAAASGASKAGNPVLGGAAYNSTQPTVTSGQAVELQASARGSLLVAAGVEGITVQPGNTANTTPWLVRHKDPSATTGTISAADSATTTTAGQGGQNFYTGSPTAASSVEGAVSGASGVAIQVSGSFSGTVVYEQSADGGVTYTQLPLSRVGSTTFSTVQTSSGADVLYGPCAGATHVRVRATTLLSGTPAVSIQAANGASPGIYAFVQSNISQIGGTAVSTGAGTVGSGVQRVTHASDDPVTASLSIIDDWDESDRCKSNIIVGQAGVAAGAGAVGATVQRVTLASDDPVTTSVQIMDDWDESDRCKVNPISGQVGVAAGNGVDGATVQRVTLASDSTGQVAPAASASATGTDGYRSAAVTNTADAIKGSSGRIYSIHIANLHTASIYVHFYNVAAASVTVGTTTPARTFLVPPGGLDKEFPVGMAFSTAISVAVTTTYSGSVAVATLPVICLEYK